MIRKGIFLVSGVLLASICAGGCSQSQKQASATDEEQALFACTDSITTVCDSMKLTQIRDNAQERLMELSLFGELPQTLIDSLGISQGVPASISTFLLEIDGKRILFDTGMGAPDSRLLTNLSAVGVTPADIDYQVGKFIIVGDLVHGASLQLAHPEISPPTTWTRKRLSKNGAISSTTPVRTTCSWPVCTSRQIMRNNPYSFERTSPGYTQQGLHPVAGTALVVSSNHLEARPRYISFVRLNSLSAKSSARPEICL